MLPRDESSSDATLDELIALLDAHLAQIDAWIALIDREAAWLVETGRLPPADAGFPYESVRLNLYPTYDSCSAASLLGVDVEEIDRAVLAGELDGCPVYADVMIGYSSLDRFARARSTPRRPPQGGEWELFPDSKRALLVAQQRREIEGSVQEVAPKHLGLAMLRLDEKERIFYARVQREQRGTKPRINPAN